MSELSWKKRIILGGVLVYFLIGILAAIPPHLYLRQYLNNIPLLSNLLTYCNFMGFHQQWQMFAPPPEHQLTLKYSAITTTGWGPMQEPFPKLVRQMEGSFIFLRPGIIRPLAFIRYRVQQNQLDRLRLVKFYYHQLSNYYCFGDGKIPGLLRIRFYLDKKIIPPFYTKDKSGFPLPPASDEDGVALIYERDCSK